MIVIGGTYQESCEFPPWGGQFGSGLRAALAVSTLSPETVLHTFAPPAQAADLRATLASHSVGAVIAETDRTFEFAYWSPFLKYSAPRRSELPKRGSRPRIDVAGDVVVAFGMLEGDARVEARRAVYDPRSTLEMAAWSETGSTAQELAYVLQDEELARLVGGVELEGRAAADAVMRREGATVVVARHAFGDATVYHGDAPGQLVPCHDAGRWFKIGAGDVFNAAFAHYWGELDLGPVEASRRASLCVAHFADGHRLPLPAEADLLPLPPVIRPDARCVAYLCGPRETMAERYLLDMAENQLARLGMHVQLPPFDVRGRPTACRWPVISGETHAAMLALGELDDAVTNVRAGYAGAQGLPVVVLSETGGRTNHEALLGGGFEVASDLVTAVYRTVLACWRGLPEAP